MSETEIVATGLILLAAAIATYVYNHGQTARQLVLPGLSPDVSSAVLAVLGVVSLAMAAWRRRRAG